jgi:hypothetical protein
MSPSNNSDSDTGDKEQARSLSALDVLVSQGPDSKGTREAFLELSQVCLWGNATDLSLLDNPDLAKVEELQRRMLGSSSSSPGSQASSKNSSSLDLDKQVQEEANVQQPRQEGETSELEKHAEKILQNDTELLWEKVKNMRNGRVDFILDNAGKTNLQLVRWSWSLPVSHTFC